MNVRLLVPAAVLVTIGACRTPPPADRVRASGQIETTEVQVSSPVGGRVLALHVSEGQRVAAGAPIATLDTADAALALLRAKADHAQAEAQVRLLLAGARPEDIRQADAQVASAEADTAAAAADLGGAELDVQRFESLLASHSGSRKQRDDAVARRDVLRDRHRSAEQRVAAAKEAARRLRAGARREELDAARARVDAAAAQIAIVEKAMADAAVTAPIAGVVVETIADTGELLPARAPVVVLADLDRAWANVYVDEPVVPRLTIGQAATVYPDGGAPGVPGTVAAIADRAEFTPRNVQTPEDRSKLVYRVKVAVDNSAGALKVGMPVEAELAFAR